MSIKYCITAGDPEDKRHGPGEHREQFERISQAFKSEPSLLGVTAENLELSFERGLAILALDSVGSPVGYTRIQPILTDQHPLGAWFELGSTWVHPEFRGRRINEVMYQLLLSVHAGKNILATTTNPTSFGLGQKFGFVTVARKELPDAVWKSSCSCPLKKTRSETSDNSMCRYAHGEPQQSESACWFRITPETANRLDKAA